MKLNLKRFLAYLLTALMLVSVVPASAIAEITAASNTSASIRSIMPNEGVYVTFEFYAGEELVDTQIVKNGAGNVTEPKTPITEPGQKFVGWYVGNTPFIFGRVEGYTQSQTVRVEARYSDVYYVFFKDNTGRIVETKEGKTNDSIQTGDVTFPVRPTESITGWYTDKDCTPANKVESVTLGDANVTLYAKVEEGYWITYDSEGGSYIQPAFYTRGATAEAPKAPTRPGYTFDGWFTDAALTAPADFGSIKENTTVHAKWKAASTTYTVIHFWENADDNEYSYHESETKTGTTGAQTAAAAKSYPGFTAQTITQKTIAADGSTIVSVYYKRNVYTVTFWSVKKEWVGGLFGHYEYSKDKEYTDKRITAKYGQNISDKWPGGIWSISAGGSVFQANIDVMPLNGDEFFETEQGNAKAYYYLQDLKGDYVLDHTDTGASGGATVTKEDRYPITGFTCNTKKSAKNGDGYNGAKFYYDRNSYAINFISGGQPVNSQSVKYQASIAGYANYKPDKAPTGKEGYIFDGWYDNELCEGEPYAFTGKTMPAQNVTVYANWVAPVHTVTVYAADRTTVLKTITKVPHGGKIAEDAMPEVTPGEGEVFLGWVFEDGTPFSFNIEIKKDYAIYAKVGSTSKLGVTYKANAEGATGSVTDDNTYARGAFADVKPNGFTNEGKMFLYWNTRADGSGASYYPNASIKVEENVILYAIWGTPGAKVTLTYHSNFGEDAVKTTEPILVNGQVAILSYSETNLPTREGYDFTGWTTSSNGEGLGFAEGDTARLDEEGENNLWAQWTAMDRKYTVEFHYETTDGGYELKKTETRTAKTDAPVAVTEEDKAETYEGKYVFDADNELNELEGTIPATGALVLKLYFKLNTAEYTIHHYLKGTEVKVADDQTGVETVGHTLTANKNSVLYGAYANAEVDSYSPEQTITIAATGNEITVYYTVPLTITAENASKPYDGTPLTETGFTATGLVNDDTADKLALSMTAESTITNFGTQPNVIDQTTVKYDGGAIPKYYTVAYEPGTLTITASETEVVVTIVGNTKTETYDGTEQSVTGYTVESISNDLYKVDYIGFTGEATAKGTDAGTYPMGLKAEQFANTSANFSKVKFVVTDGSLTINPFEITITATSYTVEYDGQAHGGNGYTATPTVDGQKISEVLISGAATDAGTHTDLLEPHDAKIVNAQDEDVTGNYKITYVKGTLTITKRGAGEEKVKVIANNNTVTYDGQAHGEAGYKTERLAKGHKVSTVTIDGSKTDVGTYTDLLVPHDATIVDAQGNDVTKNYEITYVAGTLKIEPKKVTITAEDATKVYDGKALTQSEFTTTALEEGDTHKFAVKMTADSTIRNVGTQPNVIATVDGVNVTTGVEEQIGNYLVTTANGTLEVTPVTDEVVVKIVGKTKTETYDGTEKKVEGYTVTIDNDLYTEDDFEFSGTAYAEGTNADTYPMGLKAEQFKNVSANFTNVKFEVTDGWLKIDPRKVTLTSGDGEKVYDGTALTNSEVTVFGDGFADSEGAIYDVTGSQLNVGESENKFTYALKDDMLSTNYEIKTEFGTLKVTPVTDEVVVTITGREDSAQYDGAKHSVSGYDVAISNELYTEDCFEFGGKAVAEGVHAGEYAMGLNEKQFKNVSANFTNVKFVIERDGRLAIEQRALIITAGSYEGDYDGEWHGVGYTAEGLAETDKITALTMKDDAILYPGELTASFLPETLKITHADGTDSTGDYRVEYMPGKLVVNTVIVKYRVQYYYDGVLYGGATEEGTGEVLTKITEYRDKPRDMMFDHVDNFPLTLGLNEEENVIRVYYVHIPLTGYLGAHNVGDCIE